MACCGSGKGETETLKAKHKLCKLWENTEQCTQSDYPFRLRKYRALSIQTLAEKPLPSSPYSFDSRSPGTLNPKGFGYEQPLTTPTAKL